MARTLAAVASRVDGRLIGADAPFGAVATDTRKLGGGDLFVALRGPRFDGNDFLAEAQACGAAGALVSRPAELSLPQIEVSDTRRAFGRMAQAWRRNFDVPVVAVTGSAGKTTVKELVAAILKTGRRVCVTEGNLNNDIGVPLTLMRLEADHEALVVELGANHGGEIAQLAQLAEPTVGVITNAAAAHLEGFGSLAGVAAAKGELLDHLPHEGTSVLNADDPFLAHWRARARTANIIDFGLGDTADCRLQGDPELDEDGSTFTMRLPDGAALEVRLPLLGRQNIANALAAAAAAFAVGATPDEIRAGLARGAPVRGRLTALRGHAGARLIDDSYNANPASARAALDYLGALPGRRIFVLGDMGELGPDAERLHRELGAYAVSRCDAFVGIGPLAALAAQAYGRGGAAFDDVASATPAVAGQLGSDVTVLVKASRSVGLERLVASLAANGGH